MTLNLASRWIMAGLWEYKCLPPRGKVVGVNGIGLWYNDSNGSTRLVTWAAVRRDINGALARRGVSRKGGARKRR